MEENQLIGKSVIGLLAVAKPSHKVISGSNYAFFPDAAFINKNVR